MKLQSRKSKRRGVTSVEYAVMLSLIIVVCVVVIRQVGTSASATFSTTHSAVITAGM